MADDKNKAEAAEPTENQEAPKSKYRIKPRTDLPAFNVGDTVKVYVRIQESAEKFRLQPFEGIVLAKKGTGMSKTFMVRKISYGEGVERVFPLNSPSVAKIEVLKKGKVRKSKLFYLRERKGKSYKVEEAS